MTAAKLTPRVGDRVLVNIKPGRTYVGDVLTEADFAAGPSYGVRLDGMGYATYHPLDDLQVVDRDPVEWPEGWSRFSQSVVTLNDARTFSRSELEDILVAGPDMLARWPELMGGAE